MRKRRLHWFWRAAIAVAAGAIYGTVMCSWYSDYTLALFTRIHDALAILPDALRLAAADALSVWLGTCLLAVVTYGVLTRHFGPLPEIRCRQCSAILRDIAEPACPECGERI